MPGVVPDPQITASKGEHIMSLRDLTPWLARPSHSLRGLSDSPFDSLHREMDRMFGDFLSQWDNGGPGNGADAGLGLKLDIAETDAAYEVTADLPGVEEKDVEVSLAEGVLRIKGERKSEKEDRKKNYHRIERSFGRFERAIALPADVEEEKIDANFKKGVLKVTLPKSAKAVAGVKKIDVKAD